MPIVDRHTRRMKLFLPSARATNALLIVGFGALGYALYIRYLGIEQSAVGLACAAGLETWLCASRRIVTAMFQNSVFGSGALLVAAVNLLRPSLVGFAVALALGLPRPRALQHRPVVAGDRPAAAQLRASRT